MKLRLRLVSVLLSTSALLCVQSSGLASSNFENRRAYFDALEPGVTTTQVRETIGPPDTTYSGAPAYQLDKGVVVLEAQGDVIVSCRHYHPDSATEFRELYILRGGTLSDADYDAREQLLKSPAFHDPTRWSGQHISTNLYPDGLAFLLRDGYVVLEGYLILGEQRYVSRITRFHQNAPPEVLWRLFDHWAEVRPSELSDEELAHREAALRAYGSAQESFQNLETALGKRDGSWGSGIVRYQYYIHDGLITTVAQPIDKVHLSQPGSATQVSFEDWLRKAPGSM